MYIEVVEEREHFLFIFIFCIKNSSINRLFYHVVYNYLTKHNRKNGQKNIISPGNGASSHQFKGNTVITGMG